MHPLLARVHDSNIYVLHQPSYDRDMLIVGMMHTFDLDSRGYEARIYRVPARRVTLSPAAEEARETGWGIDSVKTTARGVVTLSSDDDLWMRIEFLLPCEVDVKRLMLSEHPEQESAAYTALRSLEANDDIAWEPTPVVTCSEMDS
jgi:hypothetical protein